MKNHLFIILLFSSFLGFSQSPNRTFEAIDFKNYVLEIKVNNGVYKIIPYSESIVETTFISSGENLDSNSHTVVLKPEPIKPELLKTNEALELKTSGISVTIQKQPFQITYGYHGKPIISEKMGYVKNDRLETIQLKSAKEVVLYGGGARALGMKRCGYRLELYYRADYGYENHSALMNYTMLIMMSSNKYRIHFDNAPIGFLDLDSKKDDTLTYETISGRKTYQVIVGDTWTDFIDNFHV